MKHFKVFGCPAWVHISSRECKAPPPRPYNFIGYDDNVKAYRLMDPETHEIFIERNIRMNYDLHRDPLKLNLVNPPQQNVVVVPING